MKIKNHQKGFTLIEIVIAIGILAIVSGLSLVAITAIPQARMKRNAQTIKNEFELTRNFAKTHGGDAVFTITKLDEGVVVERTSENVIEEVTEIEDKELAVFYRLTNDPVEYELGQIGPEDQMKSSLTLKFAQTDGYIMGPDMVDYLILSNGNKNYTFWIKHDSGMIYYDYELEELDFDENKLNSTLEEITFPHFIVKGAFVDTVSLDYNNGKPVQNGKVQTVQPEIAYDSRNVKISGVYRAKDKGTYEIRFILKDPYKMQWEDSTKTDKYLTWKIK